MEEKELRKEYVGIVKKVDSENFTVDAIVSNENKDRDDEVILLSAYKKHLAKFKKHPVLLSSHSTDSLLRQIGKWEKVEIEEGKGLAGVAKYFVGEGNQEADWGFNLAGKGIAAYSVRFIPHGFIWGDELEKAKIPPQIVGMKPRRVFTEVELLEISHVLIPANPQAVMRKLSQGNDFEFEVAKMMVEKGVVELPSKVVYVPYTLYKCVDVETGQEGDIVRVPPDGAVIIEEENPGAVHRVESENEFEKALAELKARYEMRIEELQKQVDKIKAEVADKQKDATQGIDELGELEEVLNELGKCLVKAKDKPAESKLNLDQVEKAVDDLARLFKVKEDNRRRADNLQKYLDEALKIL